MLSDKQNNSNAECLSETDRAIVVGLIAWLKGAARGDHPSITRGQAAQALTRMLAALPDAP